MPKPKKTSRDFDDELPDEKNLVGDYSTVSPSGAKVVLMTQGEVDYYNEIANRYQEDNKFTNISDLLELDRVLLHELMCYRWGQWMLNGGLDYHNNPVVQLEKNVREYSKEIRDLKSDLGIDKKTRESSKGTSTAKFIDDLLVRAKQFGVHRDEQINQIYTDFNELRGLITLYNNCTKAERNLFNANLEDIIYWLEEKFKNYDKIDEAFRQNQRIWIREELND